MALCLTSAGLTAATIPAQADPPATCTLDVPANPGDCQLIVAQPGTAFNALADYDPDRSVLTLYSAEHLIPRTDPALSWKPEYPDFTIPINRSLVPQGIYTVTWGVETVSQARIAITAIPRAATSRVLMLVPDYTYQAYNGAGGGNFYGSVGAKVTTLSMDRPQLSRPGYHDPAVNPQEMLVGVTGQRVDVALQSELVQYGYDLSDYQLLVLYGHDEYWTWPLREAIETAVTNGLNVLSMSGNTGYRAIVHSGDQIVWDDTGSRGLIAPIDARMLGLLHGSFLDRPTYVAMAQRFVSKRAAVKFARAHGVPRKWSQARVLKALKRLRVVSRRDPLFAGVAMDRSGFAGSATGELIGQEIDGIPLDAKWRVAGSHLTYVDTGTTQVLAGTWVGPTAMPAGTVVRATSGRGRTIALASIRWVQAIKKGDSTATTIAENAVSELLNSPE